jgi:hypothetical protein
MGGATLFSGGLGMLAACSPNTTIYIPGCCQKRVELMNLNRLSVAALAAFCAIGSWASASTIVDFKPLPISPNDPEFTFSRALGGGIPAFRSAFGAIGNADGTLPVANQTPGGLLVETPFIIGGVPGSQFAATSTLFFDSTLQFTAGLVANAPALNAGGIFIQQLSPGTFTLSSTDPDGPGPLLPTLLLSGNINTASFIAGTGDAGAAFNASGINYTGGVIYNALLSSGGVANGNSMSISMTDVALPFAIAGDGYLREFTANATGLFNAVPEPSSMALLVMAIGTLFLRRR